MQSLRFEQVTKKKLTFMISKLNLTTRLTSGRLLATVMARSRAAWKSRPAFTRPMWISNTQPGFCTGLAYNVITRKLLSFKKTSLLSAQKCFLPVIRAKIDFESAKKQLL